MRKLVAIATLAWAGFAFAGDYHISNTLRCSQCHTMHAARSHAFNGAGEDLDFPLAIQGNPQRNLLIQDGTNETCLACHDGKLAYPDVLGLDGGMVGGGLRSAGALNGATPSHTAGGTYASWMGHTLGTDVAPPGWIGIYEPSPVENFNCANCHAVHGSPAYRNLGLSMYMGTPNHAQDATNPFLNAGPTYNALPFGGVRASLLNDGTRDVFINNAARSYTASQISFGIGSANTSARNGMNAYCAVCHGNFHGDANTRDLIGGVDFVRHPTSGISRATNGLLLNYGTADDQTNLVRPAWSTGIGGGYEAACLSCHKGHGNLRSFALIYPDNAGAAVNFEEGDAIEQDLGDGLQYPIRNLCITCHPMGR